MAVKYGLLICCLRNETPYKGQKKLFAKTIHVSYRLSKKGFSSVIYETRTLTKAKKNELLQRLFMYLIVCRKGFFICYLRNEKPYKG